MELDQITAEVEISINEKKLKSAKDVRSSPSIFEIRECIRKGKEEFYAPSVVSIGPIHYKHPPLAGLAPMQEMKLRCLERFVRVRGNDCTLQDYIKKIGGMEDQIRASYAGKISLASYELIELVLLDASFIIDFIIGITSPRGASIEEPIDFKAWLEYCTSQDLVLLENQLPFFVLESLWSDAFPDTSFRSLSYRFLANSFVEVPRPADGFVIRDLLRQREFKHLLDMLRICFLPTMLRKPKSDMCCPVRICCLPTVLRKPESDMGNPESPVRIVLREQPEPDMGNSAYPMSASNLKASGVKFRRSNENLLNISFQNGVLMIPPFTLIERTEVAFRNLLAYEQRLHFFDTYFVDYLIFLDKLVDTSDDVEILMKEGILEHWMGDSNKPLTFFNDMTTKTPFNRDKFFYAKVCRELNDYAKIPRHNWMAVLRRDYFRRPWAIISVIYAIILLILTIIQVITGFK